MNVLIVGIKHLLAAELLLIYAACEGMLATMGFADSIAAALDTCGGAAPGTALEAGTEAGHDLVLNMCVCGSSTPRTSRIEINKSLPITCARGTNT